MIRYRVTPQGRAPIVFIGPSDENVARMTFGRPIRIKADDSVTELGVELVIYHGATEVELTRQLEENGFVPPGSTAKAEEAMARRGEWRSEWQNEWGEGGDG